jgi:hypothetical protein
MLHVAVCLTRHPLFEFTPPLPPRTQQVKVEAEAYHQYMYNMRSFQLPHRAQVLEAFPDLAAVVAGLEQQDVSLTRGPPQAELGMRPLTPFSIAKTPTHTPRISSIPHPQSAHRSPSLPLSFYRLMTSLIVPRRHHPNPPMRAGRVLSSRVDASQVLFHGA